MLLKMNDHGIAARNQPSVSPRLPAGQASYTSSATPLGIYDLGASGVGGEGADECIPPNLNYGDIFRARWCLQVDIPASTCLVPFSRHLSRERATDTATIRTISRVTIEHFDSVARSETRRMGRFESLSGRETVHPLLAGVVRR